MQLFVVLCVVIYICRLTMVRTYKQTTSWVSYGEQLMTTILEKISHGELSKRQAFKQHGIPRSTLSKRMKSILYKPPSLGRFKRVFDSEHEDELRCHATEMQREFYGLSPRD